MIHIVSILQVLLATGGGRLVYPEITNSKLVEVKHIQLEHEISCLDINPIGENPQYSSLAAFGMFSLPGLELTRKENLGEEIVPRSVLLCTIEGVLKVISCLLFFSGVVFALCSWRWSPLQFCIEHKYL